MFIRNMQLFSTITHCSTAELSKRLPSLVLTRRSVAIRYIFATPLKLWKPVFDLIYAHYLKELLKIFNKASAQNVNVVFEMKPLSLGIYIKQT